MRARTNIDFDCPVGCAGCGPLAGPDHEGLQPFVVTYHYNRPYPVIVWAACADLAHLTAPWQANACVRPATVADMADYAIALREDADPDCQPITFALVGAR